MRKGIIVLFCAFLISNIYIYSQEKQEHRDHHEKIEKLKNLKLVEYLHLDEERGIKLITRRNRFSKTISMLFREKDSLLEVAKANDKMNKQTCAKLTNRILETDKKIGDVRIEYYKSLSDILSEKEILEYLVFEKEFRKELKKLMLRRKHREKNGT